MMADVKSVKVIWKTDRFDDDLVKMYHSIKNDFLSLCLSSYEDKEVNSIIDESSARIYETTESRRKIIFDNYVLKTLLGNRSNFSFGATIAALNKQPYDEFVIPPDIIDYINEEIDTKEKFEKYVKSFPNTSTLYNTGEELFKFFIDNGYPSQTAYSLAGAAYVECAWNPNQYNKTEQARFGASFAHGWSGCGEGLFGLTGWDQKLRIIKVLNLNTIPVQCYRFKRGKIDKVSATISRTITSDKKLYDKGPSDKTFLLFQCNEETWTRIMKEYIRGLGTPNGDKKSPYDYMMYDEKPAASRDNTDDDHKLLYSSFLFKAGYGTGGTSWENLVERVEAYKSTHNRLFGSSVNLFIKQLLIGYLLSEYLQGVKLENLSLRNIVKVSEEYVKGKYGKSYVEGGSGLFDKETSDSELSIDDALYKHSDKVFDENIAAEWITKHSHASSQHSCAKYVRMAIEAGFRDPKATAGRPNWAWKYIYYLPKIGFKHFTTVHRDNLKAYTPMVGDIAVYLQNGNKNVPGHICMYTGDRWISDFKQNNMFVYKGTNEAYIYRFG